MTTPNLSKAEPLNEETVRALMNVLEQEGRNHQSITRISAVLDRLSDEFTTDKAFKDRKRIVELLELVHLQQTALIDIQRQSNNLIYKIHVYVFFASSAILAIAVNMLWF